MNIFRFESDELADSELASPVIKKGNPTLRLLIGQKTLKFHAMKRFAYVTGDATAFLIKCLIGNEKEKKLS